MVRLIAREVRGYLNALEIGKDIHNILTNYSLEVSASVHLKPLAEKLKDADGKKHSKATDQAGYNPKSEDDT